MKKLNNNWITEVPMDAEYKRYLLLDSLQHIKEDFNKALLYPNLADLLHQYQAMKNLSQAKQHMQNQFPKDLTGLNPKLLELKYESTFAKADYENYLEDLLEFSIPQIEKVIEEGKDLYNWVDGLMELEAVGVLPVYQREGYLLLYPETGNAYRVYQFKMSRIQRMGEHFRALKITYLSSHKKRAFESFQNIKLQLIKKFKVLPNPATFIARVGMQLPVSETLLPIAKRRLMETLEL